MPRTDRLILRGWQSSDLEPFAELNADPETMSYYPATLDQAESDSLADRFETRLQRDGIGHWAVEDALRQVVLGAVGLWRVDLDGVPSLSGSVEVGWRLHRRWWGFGYASDAALASRAYGFGTLGLAEIVSYTAAVNTAPRALMERIGMRRDRAGDFSHPRLPRGHRLELDVVYRVGPRTTA